MENKSKPLELLGIFLLGFLLRLYAGRYIFQGGDIVFSGADEFYHMRRILYTVEHFPNTLWFDSYINYPHGLDITWPPFFDQLLASIALALGQHSQHGIEVASAIVPAFLGSLAIVAVYYTVREIFNRKAAIMSALMTALASYHLQISEMGATDHDSLEVLFLILTIMFIVLALSRRERKYFYAVAAGIFMAGLEYTWLGSSIYFGFFFVYMLVQISLDLKNGVSSNDKGMVVLIALGVGLASIVPFWRASWLFPNFCGIIVIMTSIIILFIISKLIAKGRAPWASFPIVIMILAGAFFIVSQQLRSFWLFSAVNTNAFNFLSGSAYIEEAAPLISKPELFLNNSFVTTMDINLLLSIIGFAILLSYFRHSKQNAEKKEAQLLFMVFAIFTLILAVIQIRFLALFAITMAILIGILFSKAADEIEMSMKSPSRQSMLLILALVFALAIPTIREDAIVFNGHPDISGDWYNALKWMESNTNATKYYDNPDKIPEYSVLSWWDYGNWILYEAKRPVVVNNFQGETGIRDASKFYLSEDQKTAMDVLDERGVRYIITDYDMLNNKLPAIAVLANKTLHDYAGTPSPGNYAEANITKNLYRTTLARLHYFDGIGLDRVRLIYESPTFRVGNPAISQLKIFEYVPGAVIKVPSSPGMKAEATLKMITNQGRTFSYAVGGMQKANGYEIRVPYSTEKRYGTHSLGPYSVTIDIGANTRITKKVNVSEDDVLDGKIINVNISN